MAVLFKPFADESAVVTIGNLELENRVDRISIHGGVDLTRDKAGLKLALELKTKIDQIVTAMQGERLPERIEVEPSGTVENPFQREQN